ncbi:BUB1B-PAK6 isoform 1 [Pan troglodytes]|uniref:BUB1B-PAK6 isoform 1 n=1 Tax=Pan troglodytes TaxID=9598 RepID=A0A2J8QDF3_PANTR|nr:BUB1B-PAK6 isoform 1 [Pan troglodytes]
MFLPSAAFGLYRSWKDKRSWLTVLLPTRPAEDWPSKVPGLPSPQRLRERPSAGEESRGRGGRRRKAPCSARKRRNALRSQRHRTSSTVSTPPSTPKKASLWASPHNGRTSWTHCGAPSPWWTLRESHGCSSSP